MGALYLKVEEMQQIVKNKISEGENYIGGFHAQSWPGIGKLMLLGVFAFLQMRLYLVGVSDRKIYFHRLDMFNKVEIVDEFTFEEIAQLKVKNSVLSSTLFFKFKNGNKLALRGMIRNKGFFMNDIVINYLMEKLPC